MSDESFITVLEKAFVEHLNTAEFKQELSIRLQESIEADKEAFRPKPMRMPEWQARLPYTI